MGMVELLHFLYACTLNLNTLKTISSCVFMVFFLELCIFIKIQLLGFDCNWFKLLFVHCMKIL
jgi:hypothetical protein